MIPSLFLEPGFLEGWVRHKRRIPRPNTYEVKKTWVCIDADQLLSFGEGLPYWNFEQMGLHTLSRSDFIGAPTETIRSAVHRTCKEYNIDDEIGQILAIAACKNMGFGPNPAEFYLVHDMTANLIAIIAHFKNRLNESFPYVFKITDQYNLNFKCEKALFMSAHTQMDAIYYWAFYIGRRHFMLNLRIEKPENPDIKPINSLLFPEKARRDALERIIMDITFSSTLRPFNVDNAKELGRRYATNSFNTISSRYWNRLILNENGIPLKHPADLGEIHPKEIDPPVSIRRSRRKLF